MTAATAGTFTWTGGGDAQWSTAANWGGTAPGNSETNVLNFGGNVNTVNLNNNLTGGTNTLNFTNDGTAGKTSGFSLTGNPFTLGGNIVATSSSVAIRDTIANDLIVAGAARSVLVNGNHTILLTGNIELATAGQLTANISTLSGPGGTITVTAASSFLTITGAGGTLSRAINRDTKGLDFLASGTGALIYNGTYTGGASGTINLQGNSAASIVNDFQSKISGGTILLKNTANTWKLSNDANDFTGQFQFSAGMFIITSIADYGTACSIGMGTVGTALRLGNLGTDATLNYSGSGASCNRQILIGNGNGLGGAIIQNNGGGALIFTTNAFNLAAGANTTAGSRTLTLGGANTAANEIKGIIRDNTASVGSVVNLTKADAGKWILSGANTYSGTTTVSNGTLQVGNGTAGSLATGSLLTFGGAGTFDVQEAASSAQSMGLLTVSAGEGTVKSTYPGSDNTSLTFANVAARTAGTAANFATVNGSNGSNNKIVLTQFAGSSVPTGTLLDKGIFFSGNSYASYDTLGYLRAYTAGDANYVGNVSGANAIADDSSKNVALSGNVTAQAAAAVNTLNMGANNVTLNNTAVFGANGILSAGSGSAAISKTTASTLQAAASGGELVIRVDGAADTLTIDPVIKDNTSASALTKSGLGNLILTGVNTYTGVTAIAAGTLTIGGTGKLSNGTYTNIISGAGSLVYSSSATQTLSGASTFTGDVSINSGAVYLTGPRANVPAAAPTASALGDLTVARNINIAADATLWMQSSGNNNDILGSVTSQIAPIMNVNGGTLKVGNVAVNFLEAFNTVNLNGGTMTVNSSAATAVAILNGTVTVGGTAASTMNRGSTGANFSLSNVGTRNTMFNVGDVVSGTDLTVSAPVANGTGNTTTWPASSLTKTGLGTMLLTTNNTYTGTTTVNGGTLQVDGKIDSSDVTVMTNAVLCGTGTLGSNVTVNAGGILGAGTTNTVGSSAIAGALTLQDNSRLLVDVQSLSQNDLITVAGNVALTSAVKVEVSSGVTRSGTWTILQSTGGTISGTLPTTVSGAPKGATLSISADSKQFLLTFLPQGTLIRIF